MSSIYCRLRKSSERGIYKKLLKFCTPLKLLEADHFSYQRIYPNNAAVRLDTELDYGAFMVEKRSFDKYDFIAKFLENYKTIFLSDLSHYPNQAKSLLKQGFLYNNIKRFYAIYSYNKNLNCIEGCAVFKTHSYEKFFPKFDLLHKFKQYFLIEASNILDHIDQEKIFMHTSTSVNTHDIQNQKEKKFLELIASSKISLKIKDTVACLTRKEVICMKYLTQGYSVKEIAVLLNNAPSTIANQIYNIKRKYNYIGLNIIKEYFRQLEL